MPEPRDPVSSGDLIAEKYLVEGTLGRGGMGVVVKARHVELDQPVAIKVLREGVLDGDEATQRFMREARALARLGGEHVVRVSDVGRFPNGTPYMVMEYLDGTDLSALLKKRGPLPPQEVADYGIQVCAALADAHGRAVAGSLVRHPTCVGRRGGKRCSSRRSRQISLRATPGRVHVDDRGARASRAQTRGRRNDLRRARALSRHRRASARSVPTQRQL